MLIINVLGLVLIAGVQGMDGSSTKLRTAPGDSIPGISKIKDIIIYKDSSFYSSFPSVVKRPDGEIMVAFRHAPERKIFSEKFTNHVDANSLK